LPTIRQTHRCHTSYSAKITLKAFTSIRNAVRIFDLNANRAPGHMHVHIFSPARLNNLHSKQQGQKKAKQPK
jgi:hypothetical protein